jgi:hypothetical protein
MKMQITVKVSMGIIGGESQKKRRRLTVPTGQHFIFEMKTWSS